MIKKAKEQRIFSNKLLNFAFGTYTLMLRTVTKLHFY